MNKKKITSTMQKVAVDILQDFEILLMSHNNEPYTADEIIAIMNKHEEKYALCSDPFTRMLCISEEYAKSSLEYDRQIMYEKYGHWDGLE